MTDKTDLRIKLKDGRTLGYAEYGDPAGIPVFYFHGGMSSRYDIAFGDKRFRERGVKLIAPDRPGIGNSSSKKGRSLFDWADDVGQLAESLSIDSARLFGWSAAGPYVLICLHKMPELFTTGATIGIAPPFDGPASIMELGLLLDRMLVRCPKAYQPFLARAIGLSAKMPPAMMKKQLLKEVGSKIDRDIVAALSDRDATYFVYESIKQGGASTIEDYDPVRMDWGFPLDKFGPEFAIFHGADDRICYVNNAHRLHKLMPQAKLNIVDGQGHFLLHQKLDLVLDHLLGNS